MKTPLAYKVIDVEKVVRSSKSFAIRNLPGFVVRYLIKVIQEEEFNRVSNQLVDQLGINLIEGIKKIWNVNYEILNPEIIPTSGKYVYVGNHPIGSWDSIFLLHYFTQSGQSILTLANEVLYQIHQMREFFIKVDTENKLTREYFAMIDKAFQSESNLLIFPSGEVSRIYKSGPITDCPWKKTFLVKAIQTKRDIVPFYVHGKLSNRFYNVAKWRMRLGIKMNIEMLYFPDEMLKQGGKTIKYVFGDPIPYTFFDKSKTAPEWVEYIRQKVYRLADSPLLKA